MRNKLTDIGLAASMALCSCSSGNDAELPAENADGWSLVRSVDNFTDEESLTAQKTFETDAARIEVQAMCQNTNQVTYTFTSFGKDRAGLPFRTRTSDGYSGVFTSVSIVQVRGDQNPPAIIPVGSSDFSNQLQLKLSKLDRHAIVLLHASTVLIKLPLQNGDIDLEIDQTDPNISEALQSCRSEFTLTDAEEELITEYEDLNSRCRGGSGDDPETIKACDKREALSARLNDADLCYGKEDQAEYQMSWRRC